MYSISELDINNLEKKPEKVPKTIQQQDKKEKMSPPSPSSISKTGVRARLPWLPSNPVLIFLGSTALITGLYAKDRYLAKKTQEKLIARVKHLAEEPLGPLELPRKVKVFIEAPDNDHIRKTKEAWTDYVKPST